MTLLDFQIILGRRNIRPPHFASKVSYSASPQASAKCPRGASCSYVVPAMLFGSKSHRDFSVFLTPNLGGFSFRALSYENKAERQREWRENVNAPPNLTAFCRIL
jgi:hypothetical protein